MSSLAAHDRAPRTVMSAMFLVALTVLTFQIALTRLMSVMVSNHSAFLVLALVMLGLAASAIAVFLQARRNPDHPLPMAAAAASRNAALWTAGSLLVFVQLVALLHGTRYNVIHILLAAVLFAPSFHYAGYVIAALLTHHARDVGRLYWADLSGAAAGCLVVVPLLNATSAMNAVLACAGGMAAASVLLAAGDRRRQLQNAGVLVGLAVVFGLAVAFPKLTEPRHPQGPDDIHPIWQRWNNLAKVSVWKEVPTVEEAIRFLPEAAASPEAHEEMKRRWQAGWGMSQAYRGPVPRTLWIELDAGAGTQMVGVRGASPASLEYLKWDVTSAAYWLKPNGIGRAFVIGGGGGRDVLTALVFGSADVDVVELNPTVVEAALDRFGDFTDRLYDRPNVHLTVGEARSELSRRSERYDVIQMSMVDTFAASTAGALVLTENTLYTREAFSLYLSRLKDDGLLSITRWYTPRQYGELARLLTMIRASLLQQGAEHPEEHVAVVYNQGYLETSVATCIVKRSPITAAERARLVELCGKMNYVQLWPAVEGVSRSQFLDVAPLLASGTEPPSDPEFDLEPPTDDRPFFFNTRRPVRSWVEAIRTGDLGRGSRADVTLGGILLVMLAATLWVIVRPMELYRASLPEAERRSLRFFGRPIAYFAGIGLGFMFVELALIQRYILFLGHPTYAISLVLFTLLLSSGAGSALSTRLPEGTSERPVLLPLAVVFLLILFTAFGVPPLLEAAHGWPLQSRLALAAALIVPLGLGMGMIYPLGVRSLTRTGQEGLVPWLWGVNGMCGMAASVVGMGVAMSFGYTTVLLLAAVAYLVTAWSVLRPWESAGTAAKQL